MGVKSDKGGYMYECFIFVFNGALYWDSSQQESAWRTDTCVLISFYSN